MHPKLSTDGFCQIMLKSGKIDIMLEFQREITLYSYLNLIGFLFCSNIATEDMLYTESDIENSMDKIETINFHQVLNELLMNFCTGYFVTELNLDIYHYIKEIEYLK